MTRFSCSQYNLSINLTFIAVFFLSSFTTIKKWWTKFQHPSTNNELTYLLFSPHKKYDRISYFSSSCVQLYKVMFSYHFPDNIEWIYLASIVIPKDVQNPNLEVKENAVKIKEKSNYHKIMSDCLNSLRLCTMQLYNYLKSHSNQCYVFKRPTV